IGFAFLSAVSSCARPSFFSGSGTDLSALSAAISFLICSDASVNFLVCGSMPDMIIVIFVNTSSYWARLAKPFFFGDSRGLRLHLRTFRFVRLRAIVELGDVLVGGHEVLNMLVGEFDLLHHLLRSGRAVIKQSESQKRREQQTQKSCTREHRVSVSNERHRMVLRFDYIACILRFWPRHDDNPTEGAMSTHVYANVMRRF